MPPSPATDSSRPKSRRLALLLGSVTAGTFLFGGCGPNDEADPAAVEAAGAVVESYLEAIPAAEYPTACELLSPTAQEQLADVARQHREHALAAEPPSGSPFLKELYRQSQLPVTSCETAFRFYESVGGLDIPGSAVVDKELYLSDQPLGEPQGTSSDAGAIEITFPGSERSIRLVETGSDWRIESLDFSEVR